jgi:hypothetical protein
MQRYPVRFFLAKESQGDNSQALSVALRRVQDDRHA